MRVGGGGGEGGWVHFLSDWTAEINFNAPRRKQRNKRRRRWRCVCVCVGGGGGGGGRWSICGRALLPLAISQTGRLRSTLTPPGGNSATREGGGVCVWGGGGYVLGRLSTSGFQGTPLADFLWFRLLAQYVDSPAHATCVYPATHLLRQNFITTPYQATVAAVFLEAVPLMQPGLFRLATR